MALKIWYRHQTDRLIIDYLVREGNYELASKFSSEFNLADFEDIDLFVGKVKPVVEALKQGDCKEVAKWMQANASKLKKLAGNMVAKFELELRIQEFVSILLDKQPEKAFKFSQETLSPYLMMGADFGPRVKHAIAFIAFANDPDSEVFQEFTGEKRWEFLIASFHQVFFALYGLSENSLLSISVLSGLHALSTPSCLKHAKDIEAQPVQSDCPACNTDASALIEKLPMPHRPTSSLVCPITHLPLDETNYPLALPDGQVYSKTAIDNATHFDTQSFTDPRTGHVHLISDLRRVYIM